MPYVTPSTKVKEIKTYIHMMEYRDSGAEFTIDTGWEIQSIEFGVIPSPNGSAHKATHVRYLTLYRIVSRLLKDDDQQ